MAELKSPFEFDKDEISISLSSMGLRYDDTLLLKLEQFIKILSKWNKVYNLTAIRDPRQMITHHLLDSLSILPYLEGRSVLDVGSGAGIPGIPLAIFNPQLDFTLLDSNRKKTRFIAQAAIELGLKNVEVVTSRVEEYVEGRTFYTVMARAFASVEKMLLLTHGLCAENGSLLLMKGVIPEQELQILPENFELRQIVRLNVPGLTGERHLIILSHCGRK